jgi:DNA-binding NarL/FixJ family response regulator
MFESNPTGPRAAPRNRVTILVVEAADVLRERLGRYLAQLPGVAVTEVRTASEAMAHLAGRATDVVTLDVDLAVWPDLGALSRVRKAAPAATLIVLGSESPPELVAFCRRAGADFFFRTHTEFERIGEVLVDLQARVPTRDPAEG